MWQPSPSPEESWSDASGGNEEGEWPVKAIVGEEIRLNGTSRYGMLHHEQYSPSQRAFTDMKYVHIHHLLRPSCLPLCFMLYR